MLTLYWISVVICALICIPLCSNPNAYLEEALPENYQTEKWYKTILLFFIIASVCPAINTLMAIYITIQVCKMLF